MLKLIGTAVKAECPPNCSCLSLLESACFVGCWWWSCSIVSLDFCKGADCLPCGIEVEPLCGATNSDTLLCDAVHVWRPSAIVVPPYTPWTMGFVPTLILRCSLVLLSMMGLSVRTLSLQREGGCCGLCAEVIILMSDWSESTLFGVRQRLSALSARLWAILLWWTLEIGKLSQQVVFVVGHQRSATSVMGYWSRMVNRESKCRISSTIWNQWFYHRNNIRHNLTTDMKTCFLESTSFTKR